MIAQLICACAAGLLCIWGVQRVCVLASALRASKRAPPLEPLLPAPVVTVQVPLYNEAAVCVRAVDSACALRWPSLEVQILDDSTDETTALVAAAVAGWRAAGVDVSHIRRSHREGFKAGALAHGVSVCRGELIAIFDADFVVPADFLERVVPRMVVAGADMAQARWGHLNRDASWLTRAQAALLDAHFAVEQRGRGAAGAFFGFNGTAGIWRKQSILDAGGWDAATLTEDLDLSLRAWLRGARFLYLDDVVVPAELPEGIAALRIQQHRWAKGAMQTARARIVDVLRARQSLWSRLDVALKLTQNFTFVILFLLVLAIPLAALERAAGASPFAAIDPFVFALGGLPAFASLLFALWRCGRSLRQAAVDALLAFGLAVAMSPHAAQAAIAGLLQLGSQTFQRTPKDGAHAGPRRAAAKIGLRPIFLLEGAVGALHIGVAMSLAAAGFGWRVPFLVLCGGAFLHLVGRSLIEAAPSLRVVWDQRVVAALSTAMGRGASDARSPREPS